MQSIQRALQLLDSVRGKKLLQVERVQKAIDLAVCLFEATQREATTKEKTRERWLGKMAGDPVGRLFLTSMADQCFRSQSNARTADQLLFSIHKWGIPSFLNETDRVKFLLFRLFGKLYPNLFIPRIKKQIRNQLAAVLLPENPRARAAYFSRYKNENIQVNLNHLGEAILGEGEAKRRLQVYLDDLTSPDVEYISVKISTIFSQINMLGWKENLEILSERLKALYREALKHTPPKFVNLDMEEYKDLELTVALFQKVLDEPEFLSYQAGIVLQSYLPDSYLMLQKLTKWAKQRVSRGGAPIKVRLVKGANLALESVEASIRGWEQAPFTEKIESDANFKRMLEYAAQKEHADAVHIGFGSHNLFDIAYCMILRTEQEIEDKITFEMLEGMAEPMRRVIKQIAGKMVLYCPDAKEKDFQSAVAYLIRRLDENCAEENFLRHFFEIQPGNPAWKSQVERFTQSVEKIKTLEMSKRRTQNRLLSPHKPDPDASFHNEPDTDFSLEENRSWADRIFAEYKDKNFPPLPLLIDGDEILGEELADGIDPSRPEKRLYQYALANEADTERALRAAKKSCWKELSPEKRSEILGNAAHIFRERRAKLIGTMIADGGKTIWEADPEVSEAIDFIEYYRKKWALPWQPKGTVLVTPPWNFPCSIPAGGIAAALTAGNAVLFKPAPEAVYVGWELAGCFWEAGVPRDALQFLNCAEEPVGSHLIQNPDLDVVILTGATATARKFMKMRPSLDLHAETGGKNALIITAMSDRDLSIRDLIHSAFSHSGQKCSACSLAILEAEVYDDPIFQRQLKEAAESLTVGSAWNPSAKVTPLIRPPEGALLRGLTELEEGEWWLLEPKQSKENKHLWSPGIKYGVQPGSFMHQTELFGPVLAVMRAANLDEAIEIANGTPYGLTSGLHSLDEREHAIWKRKIIAGNLYINRGITGAIVQRQPFGGCKASGFGSGAKTGGPNYVSQFAIPEEKALPQERAPLPSSLLPLFTSLNIFNLSEEHVQKWKKSVESYAYWIDKLKKPVDPSQLIGQDNYFFHVPLEKIALRVQEKDSPLFLLQVVSACKICETSLEISTEIPFPQVSGLTFIHESEEEFMNRLHDANRIRLLSLPSELLKKKAAEKGCYLQSAPPSMSGERELLHYLREVSLSMDYHRYGYLGVRERDRHLAR